MMIRSLQTQTALAFNMLLGNKSISFLSLCLFWVSSLGLGCGVNNDRYTRSLDLEDAARAVIGSAKNCALITVDSSGIAHARAMDPFSPDEDFVIWMATNPNSRKVRHIEHNPNTSLYYFDPIGVSYVTLQGKARLVNDPMVKKQFWKKEWKSFYKNRTTDYLLIRFDPHTLDIVSEKHHILGDSITWRSPHKSLQ